VKRAVFAVVLVAALVLTVGTVFAAGGTKVCVPQTENKPLRTPQGGCAKAGSRRLYISNLCHEQ
jgi:hypothetical protein